MSNETVETINSNEMQILSDFDYAGDVVDNITHFYLGVLNNFVVLASKNLADRKRGQIFFERTNYAEVLARIEDVFAGKLRQVPDVDYYKIEKGGDKLLIGMNAVQPHTALAPIIKFYLQNNRKADFDKLEKGSWYLSMSPETGERMLAEMKRIQSEVTE